MENKGAKKNLKKVHGFSPANPKTEELQFPPSWQPKIGRPQLAIESSKLSLAIHRELTKTLED